MSEQVIGRAGEIGRLRAELDRLPQRGGSLVLRGDAGVGKSTLLEWAAGEAGRRQLRTVTLTGVQAEFDLPYAGLDRLAAGLPASAATAADRDVVRAALDGDLTPVRVALALLTLLTDAAETLLLVDDAQWLDAASWDALTFVARRLSGDPVLILLTMRNGAETTARLAGAALPELAVEPLAAPDAAALLDQRAPALRADLRDRILTEAAGNPLGLVELASLGDRSGRVPDDLPLPARLERSFALSVSALPEATQLLLQVAAFNDGSDGYETVAAAADLAGITLDDLTPAVAAGLVQVSEFGALRFRHPLVRSALRQAVPAGRRRDIHAALAAVIPRAPGDERRIWHLAAATTRPDEQVAAELAEAAQRARRRGTLGAAITGLERAAQLTPDPDVQAHRLMWALTTAHELGDHETLHRLIALLSARPLPPTVQARLSWFREVMLGSGWSGADRLGSFIEAVDRVRQDGDPELALTELAMNALRCYWSNADDETRMAMVDAVERFDLPADNAERIAVLAMAAPLERGPEVIAPIERMSRQLDGTADQLDLLAVSASGIGSWRRSNILGRAAADAARSEGRLGLLTQTLVTESVVAGQLGDVRLAERAGTEALTLAQETRQPRWELTASIALGYAAALRGDSATAQQRADEAEGALLPVGAYPMLALVQLVRGVDALAQGRHATAFERLAPIFDPGDVPFHPAIRLWAVSHLADAAVGCGREDDLRAIVDGLPDVDLPLLRMGRAYVAALLEPGEIEGVIDADYPFERARLQHAHGSWLRRQRQVSESRVHLRAAITALTALGVTPWAERARAELRAAGESQPAREDARDRLTPQELQIAMLAADGLTNRDIGERLFLSHRTISTHLYRIFPKLGVTSRTELVRTLISHPS
ncbi:LuxR C-terminal-related transcriptional regulator [Actinoplanes sp. TRM 88003]|uniref:LuxR C-terminal-related transcriptional regulator n=1 Tax=Paractinoplanes aksuensis TaxID=2939490 RepID=A0ABT1DIJ1_9ACTN|nr:LuxR family transcriptional regulator [Actinoplanes aksuensis]MCO8270630.1 LuxR C-terminal-related transcriptional regulator [Actinoplanes aksuensis]